MEIASFTYDDFFRSLFATAPSSETQDDDGYLFVKKFMLVKVPLKHLPKKFNGEIFRKSMNWWLSCGKTGSLTRTHFDPCTKCHGLLMVCKGTKYVFLTDLPKSDPEAVSLNNTAGSSIFGDLDNSDGYDCDKYVIWSSAWGTSLSKINEKRSLDKQIKGKCIKLEAGSGLIFNASCMHAVYNCGLTVAIAGEIVTKNNKDAWISEVTNGMKTARSGDFVWMRDNMKMLGWM